MVVCLLQAWCDSGCCVSYWLGLTVDVVVVHLLLAWCDSGCSGSVSVTDLL